MLLKYIKARPRFFVVQKWFFKKKDWNFGNKLTIKTIKIRFFMLNDSHPHPAHLMFP